MRREFLEASSIMAVTLVAGASSVAAGTARGQGAVRAGTLRGHGDLGLGTFENLDSEIVIIHGHVFQVRSDGSGLHRSQGPGLSS